jgi:CDP-diacylglycerol pyrophosphatase
MNVLRRLVALAMAVAAVFAGIGSAHADPNALWTIVHDECVPHQINDGDPAPCALVDVDGGYIVMKDRDGQRQFLLIPTRPITGIESPELLAPDAPNYFADAWDRRYFVDAQAGRSLPPDWMSLAINSQLARSQNQMHIHMDCLRADVHDALMQYPVGPGWAPFPVNLAGAPYQAIKVADLNAVNVFRLLARDDMARWTVVVTGSADGGFVVLAGQADPAAGVQGSGEDLQDHDTCAAPKFGK